MRKSLPDKKSFVGMALAAACWLIPTTASAQRYFTEDFDSFTTGNLYQQGRWVKYGAGTSDNTMNVEEGSLVYEGYSTDATGNCVKMENLKKCYSYQAPYDRTLISSGTVYVSALVNIENAGDGNPFLRFVRSKTGDGTVNDKDYGFNVGFLTTTKSDNEGKFKFGIGKVRPKNAVNTDEEFDLNKTYLVVMGYTFVEGDNNDIISLWVNPADFTTEPAATLQYSSTSEQDLEELSAIVLARNSSKLGTDWNDMKIDAIHIAGSWKDLFSNTTTETTYSQQLTNKNIVIVENFTNTGCGPCAKFAPVLDQVVNDKLGDVICLKCHGSYPDREDPFYLSEQANLDQRIAFYGINSYPTLLINGTETRYSLSPTLLGAMFDNARETDMKYDITMSCSSADHKLKVEGDVSSNTDVTDASSLRLFAVAIEEYYKAPKAYSNGESEMEYVAKRFMPDGNGAAIAQSIEKDTPYNFSFSCSLDNFYDENELGVVAFVQDINTKQIVASAYIPKEAKADDYANLISVDDTPDFICTPDFYGNITFRNDGRNDLKSAKINVEVNGVSHSYDWSGDLARLEKTKFSIEGITDFTLTDYGSKNVAKVWLSEINGTSNESNAISINFNNSMQARYAVRMDIYTDKKPEETTWKVFNSAGDVVQEGGPYTEARHKYKEVLDLKTDDCYSLAIYDAGGDGISGAAYGNGYYQIYQLSKGEDGEVTSTRLTQGTFTNSECDIAFNLKDADSTLGIDDVKAMSNKNAEISFYDESGRMLLHTTIGRLTEADMLSVGKGARIVKINDGIHTYVNKYVINK